MSAHDPKRTFRSTLFRRPSRDYRCAAFMTLAKSAPREPTKSTAPAASGKSGIRVCKVEESRTITMIARASEPHRRIIRPTHRVAPLGRVGYRDYRLIAG